MIAAVAPTGSPDSRVGSGMWSLLHKCVHSGTFSWCPVSTEPTVGVTLYLAVYPDRVDWTLALAGSKPGRRTTLALAGSKPGRRTTLALAGSQPGRRTTLTQNPGRWGSLAWSGSSPRRRKTPIPNP